MLASQAHIITYRETPADAEVISQRLMIRAGLIHKTSSGLYVYTAMLYRTLKKIQAIISEEMAAIGALEFTFPIPPRSGAVGGERALGGVLTLPDDVHLQRPPRRDLRLGPYR
ncbi:MAG: hypothetical protein IPI35_07675 [Deltaproteobacteria bacterium]|nr:hypothetical protein [Deltaproteobacteria bacterium]